MIFTQPAVFLVVFFALPLSTALHLRGRWNSENFFIFLAKFGFQKTNPRNPEDTQGYIYGNITAVDTNAPHREDLTLVVVDSEYFIDFYGNRTLPVDEVCPVVFKKIDTIAFDYPCNQKGVEDFLRVVPCPKGQLCTDEDNPNNVIPGYQFTYKVRDVQQPRFWYVSIVSCTRPKEGPNKCNWTARAMKESIEIQYDIWLVNGNPSSKALNPFEHQFSFEFHDVFEIHFAAFLILLFIFLLWLYAFHRQRHIITKIFTAVLAGELLSTMLSLIHVTVFAFDGMGVGWLAKVGELLDVVMQCLFMLLLLLMGKGWAITSSELKWKSVLFGICGAYTLLNLFLYIWNLVEIDNIISNTDEWQTWPGYATLIFRLVVMLWFLVELRRTYHHSHLNLQQSKANSSPALHRCDSNQDQNLNFIPHFGAFILLWFIYLPVLALISTQVSALWRYKTILSISYAADILAYAVLVHLFWPSRSVLFMVNERPLPTYDLEITGLLEDMQETTLFSRDGEKEVESIELEKRDLRNGQAAKAKKTSSKSNGANGHVNSAYKDELSSDEDGH